MSDQAAWGDEEIEVVEDSTPPTESCPQPTLPSVAPPDPNMPGEQRIVDPNTGGMKGQKPERYDLIPFDALDEVARVYGVGAKKYAEHNWLRGYRWSLSLGALLRHVARWALGEDYDNGPGGTGCHHLACAVFHCLALLTFHSRKLGTDDRAKKGHTIDDTQGET